jgi:hypothetical protein
MSSEKIKEVHDFQRKLGMDPRNDSKLTLMYANGETELSAEEVAKELMAVDFIYKKTLYGELIEEYMRDIALKIRRKYRIPWGDTWNIVRFYAPSALKLQCLSASFLNIPEKFNEQ